MPNQFELPLAPEKSKNIVEETLSRDDPEYQTYRKSFDGLPEKSKGIVETYARKTPHSLKQFIRSELGNIRNEQMLGVRIKPTSEKKKRAGNGWSAIRKASPNVSAKPDTEQSRQVDFFDETG